MDKRLAKIVAKDMLISKKAVEKQILVFVNEDGKLLDVYFHPAGELDLVVRFNNLSEANAYKKEVKRQLENNEQDDLFPEPKETLEKFDNFKIEKINESELESLWEERNYSGE